MKGLYKIDPADLSSVEPGKVSELMLDFAAPLLRLDPDGLPDIDALRSVLQLAEICWNLPVYERTDDAKHAEFKRGFDSVLQSVPEPILSRAIAPSWPCGEGVLAKSRHALEALNRRLARAAPAPNRPLCCLCASDN